MYDISKLKSLEECRTVMQRALERQLPELYNEAFRRMCQLAGFTHDDPEDPLVADFHETLAAYEQLLTEKNERNTLASRTRQKIAKKGVYVSLIEWTKGKTETEGFKLLVKAGLFEYTAEYLVARYASRFPTDIVALAKERLTAHSVPIPNTIASDLAR